MKSWQKVFSAYIVLLFIFFLPGFAGAQASQVVQLSIVGGIGPGQQSYINRGLLAAKEQNARAVVLRIDTPGGLSQSMRGIIKSILRSPVPVIGYVAPSGARAASAGTFILAATSIAAMAPATNLGAATPVAMGGGFPGQQDKGKKEAKNNKPSASEKKVLNDARAYIRSLGQLHGRNTRWLERAVTHGASLSAKEALRKGVIDLIAPSVAELLKQVDGRRILVAGTMETLKTSGAQVVKIDPGAKEKFLRVITNPSLAYILLMVGIYGLLLEFFHPGVIVPGVVGAIALIVGLYALNMLPINYAGLGLVILGILLLVAEIFAPSFGILGLAGIVSFVIGSVLLVKPGPEGGDWSIPWGVITAVTVVTAGFVYFVLSFSLKARRRRIVSGVRAMSGQIAVVEQDGQWVQFMGERWRYESKEKVVPGQRVIVKKVKGLVVVVEPETDEAVNNERRE